ncbi:WG repeat-containing protein [Psychrobacter sp. Ps4]|uniref:WG repeat-containing protein n=1 Tax=Psychrobacter sp. Ps4 TaxID=2790958 RepID=UPI001EE08D21|nr:WG repeat-containing protein [Psychrobacter sp. Ps4]MCG3808038.1 WG repeat-containing protein [Psychrobacter sp. Ps4]
MGNAKIANALPVVLVGVLVIATGTAQATISCAGYLPNSYFERIETNVPFAGKLVELTDGSQQLQDLNGTVILDGLTDGYILMDKYLLAQKNGKYGVVNAAGKIIVPFEYDDIQTEPDITTSFIVSVKSSDDARNATKQGIINRHGGWVYPLDNAHIEHAHYDSAQDYFIVTNNNELTGLLDDRGYWAVMPQYDAIHPLNACTGEPLYLQVSFKNKTALIDQNNDVIIPLAANQHIESFNNSTKPLLFLRSTLVAGSTATGMSEDIQEDIISAQIIDANGKLILASDAPIRKLLYHQLYTYKQAGKFGIINDKGEVTLKPQFDSYRDDADKVWLEKNGKMRRLNTLITLE